MTDQTIQAIKEILDTEINPAVAAHSGRIEFISYAKGILTVQMTGACDGCSLTTQTLQTGVKRVLQARIAGFRDVVPGKKPQSLFGRLGFGS